MKHLPEDKFFPVLLILSPDGWVQRVRGKYYLSHGEFREKIDRELVRHLVNIKILVKIENYKYGLSRQAQQTVTFYKKSLARRNKYLWQEIFFTYQKQSCRGRMVFSYGNWGYVIGKFKNSIFLFEVKTSLTHFGVRWKAKKSCLSFVLNDEVRAKIEQKLQKEENYVRASKNGP